MPKLANMSDFATGEKFFILRIDPTAKHTAGADGWGRAETVYVDGGTVKLMEPTRFQYDEDGRLVAIIENPTGPN
jgi:hypothetical protein